MLVANLIFAVVILGICYLAYLTSTLESTNDDEEEDDDYDSGATPAVV